MVHIQGVPERSGHRNIFNNLRTIAHFAFILQACKIGHYLRVWKKSL